MLYGKEVRFKRPVLGKNQFKVIDIIIDGGNLTCQQISKNLGWTISKTKKVVEGLNKKDFLSIADGYIYISQAVK